MHEPLWHNSVVRQMTKAKMEEKLSASLVVYISWTFVGTEQVEWLSTIKE